MSFVRKARIAALIALIAVFAASVWLFSIPLSPLISEGAFYWAAFISSFSLIVISGTKGLQLAVLSNNRTDGYNRFTPVNANKNKYKFFGWTIVVLPWVAFFIMQIIPSPIFGTGIYREQIGEIEIRQFTSDIQPIDISRIPIVDKLLAYKLADKKLGEKPSLGSQVTLGEPTIQKVNDKLFWVVPLEHSGFFKWLSNREGTPGYIMVSATDQKDVAYVDSYAIKYQPSAYFMDQLLRHTRFSGSIWRGLTDFSFELDDTGRPYWVVSTYRNLRGLGLQEATGAVIVDAGSGEAKTYDIADIPAWVDRVQPEYFIINQLSNRGQYIHGILNFSNKDKYLTSEGSAIVYNNGRCNLFTGLTSVGADESAIGFVLVDMVTKKVNLYQMSGATEYAAQRSAEGKIQHLNYNATFPLVVNVENIPTYFMALKDNEGLIKQYAFVSVTDYTSVGNGESIGEAHRNYLSAVRSMDTGGISQSGGIAIKAVEGTVLRIASEVSGTNVTYRMIINEMPDIIFNAYSNLSEELAITREGDRVRLTYADNGNSSVELKSFDNLAFTQR